MKTKMQHMAHGARGHPDHIGFKQLSAKVAGKYRRKGFSKKESKLIGNETAAKVARQKRGF